MKDDASLGLWEDRLARLADEMEAIASHLHEQPGEVSIRRALALEVIADTVRQWIPR
jgi:hypothetical protein